MPARDGRLRTERPCQPPATLSAVAARGLTARAGFRVAQSSSRRRGPAEEPAPAWRLGGTIDGVTVSFALTRRETVVGSLPSTDLPLRVRGVSRRHAALECQDGGLQVVDLGSRNGTFVNGLRVQSRRVERGDEIRFGPVALRLEQVDAADATLAITGDLGALGPLENETEWLGGAQPMSSLELVRQLLVRLLAGRAGPPHVVDAFSLLAQHLEVAGGALGEWGGLGEPNILATWGEVGTQMEARELYDFFGEVHSRGSATPSCRSASVSTEPPLFCCGFRRPGATLLGLVLRGGEHRADRPILAELFLRVLDQSRFCAPERDRPRLGASPGVLAPPLGVVRGASAPMKAVYRQIEQIRSGDFPVLVIGETGVGKEHLVRLIHDSSPRRSGPLVVVNCAAIPADLLEAEMFGIGRGVASGVQERPGKFRLAEGGILFLDEIGEMPPALQPKLLRALESGEVHPVGSRPVPVDVRLVAATNADLHERVASGAFRADLYYRIGGCQVLVPPLRERPEDIPMLVQHFFSRFSAQANKRISGITVRALRLLAEYSWPGNVRQLENEVRRLVYCCADGQAIDSQLIHPVIRGASSEPGRATGTRGGLDLDERVDQLEGSLIREALRSAGSHSGAARLLGLSRNGLAAKMRRLGIEREPPLS